MNRFLLVFFIIAFSTFYSNAQIDVCGAGAPTLTVNGACGAYNVQAAFTADATAASCVSAGNTREDGWYQFVATATSTTVAASTNRDLVIAVYNGGCAGAQVACVDAFGSGTSESTTFATTIGTTYFIRLIRYNSGAANNMTGNVCVSSPAANDECAAAISLTQATSCVNTNATNTGATASGGVAAPTCSSYGNNDVWFSFVATDNVVEITTAAGSLTDAGLSLYSGACGSLTQMGCDDDSGPGLMPYLTMCGLSVGTTYYIRVWGYGGASGSFSICVEGPASGSTTECTDGTTVCSDASFTGNSSGDGGEELSAANAGCLLGLEHQSSWYFFQAATAGTIEMLITPSSAADDYDFAIWGPSATSTCVPCTTPLRCSWAASLGTTGLVTGSGDNTENDFGNRYVNSIVAAAGDQFIMVIDNFSASAQPFTLDWTLTGGATLDCTVLPVQLNEFYGKSDGSRNQLFWLTISENNNHYFGIERSDDGIHYSEIARVDGAGITNEPHFYSIYDENPLTGINYYRLRQVDFDGRQAYSNVVVLKNNVLDNLILFDAAPIPASESLTLTFKEELPEGSSVEIIDVTGRTIFSQPILVESGTKKPVFTFNISDLNAGTYFVRVLNNKHAKSSYMKKIVIE